MKKSSVTLSSQKTIVSWKLFQIIFWLIGFALWLCMLIKPALGVTLFWNVLIPIAPALLVIATGVWRNICPLATTSLLPDKSGFSKRKKLSASQRATLNLTGVILLFLIIPLRHLLFNTNGCATAAILLAISIIAFTSGILFERKSGWCSGLCPVHPVEKLYGDGVAFSMPNAHCSQCVKCSVPCPDSTLNFTAFISHRIESSKAIEMLLIGGFPGFIWGWFHVPDYTVSFGWWQLLTAYAYPICGAALSILLYFGMQRLISKRNKKIILNLFAAAAVSCYYWFRLPILFGFDKTETNGLLVDVSGNIPIWVMTLLKTATVIFFFWWMIIRTKKKISWAFRPAYSQ
jgi:hypothetical protein